MVSLLLHTLSSSGTLDDKHGKDGKHQFDIFRFQFNILTSIAWIAMEFGTNIQMSLVTQQLFLLCLQNSVPTHSVKYVQFFVTVLLFFKPYWNTISGIGAFLGVDKVWGLAQTICGQGQGVHTLTLSLTLPMLQSILYYNKQPHLFSIYGIVLSIQC